MKTNNDQILKCMLVFIHSVCYFRSVLTKTEMSQQIFVKIPNVKFH